MRRHPGVLRLALAFAALLAAGTFAIWRQGRALESLRALEQVRRERVVVEAERAAQLRRIQVLERRERVVGAAAVELGMRLPRGSEIVILRVGGEAGELGGVLVLGQGAR
jgi:hypothetical protein